MYFAGAVAVNIHRTFCVFFGGVVVFNITAVAGHFSQTQQTGLFGQHFVDLIHAHAQSVVQVEDNRRVDIAGTGTHDRAFQRVRPIEVSTHLPLRIAETEPPLPVAGDNVQFFYRLVQHFAAS